MAGIEHQRDGVGAFSVTVLAKSAIVRRMSLWVRSGAWTTWKPAEFKKFVIALASLAGFGSAVTEV
jgi:hypothetical protein